MITVNDRCGILGRLFFLALLSMGEGVCWRCAGLLCASYMWCWNILECAVVLLVYVSGVLMYMSRVQV